MKTRILSHLTTSAILLGSGANAANIFKLSTGNLDDGAGWNGGVAPGGADIGVFDGTSVPTAAGATFNIANNVFPSGYQFTDINGNVNISGNRYIGITGGGIDMSTAAADVTVGWIRLGSGSTFTIAAGRTLTSPLLNSSQNVFTLGITGGGTYVNSGTLGTDSGRRLAVNVTGSGTTLAGTGTYTPNNTNTGYGMQLGTGTFISPGVAGIGNMTVNSSGTGQTLLQMLAGSGFKFDLGAGGTFASPGSSDLLTIAGAAMNDVVFNGNNINFLGTGTAGVFRLFDSDLAADGANDAYSGITLTGQEITGGLAVSNLASGLTGKLYLGDGASFGDLGDIYVQVVPEPSAALLGALGALCLLRRKRA